MVGCNSHFSTLVYLPGSMQVWVVSFWGHRQWSHHQWLSIIHVKHGTNHFGWREFVEAWSYAILKNEIFQNTHLEMVPGSSTQHWQQCWVFRQCFEAVAAGAVAESLFVHSWEKSSAIPGWQGRQCGLVRCHETLVQLQALLTLNHSNLLWHDPAKF